VIQPRNPSEYGPDNASKMTPIAILNFRQNLSMLAIPPSLRSYLGQLLTDRSVGSPQCGTTVAGIAPLCR